MTVKVDTHTHTLASTHAFGTILENTAAAKEMGLEMICMTDHTPALPDAPHIWHFNTLKRLPREINGVRVLKGAEANLLDTEGNIDLPQYLQDELEIIVASIHKPIYIWDDKTSVTKTYLGAIKNPNITVLGHTGDIRFPYEVDTVAAAAAEYNKCIEINNNSCKNPLNTDFYFEIIRACKKYKTFVAVSSDSHTPFEVGHFEYAAALLEKENFPEEQVANRDAARFTEYLKKLK